MKDNLLVKIKSLMVVVKIFQFIRNVNLFLRRRIYRFLYPHHPWWCYGALKYFSVLTHRDNRILEFGSGFSTLYFAKNYAFVYSVEHNAQWHQRMSMKIANRKNVFYQLSDGDVESYTKINGGCEKFDVLIVDGKHRVACTLSNLDKLNEGSIIVIDNIESMFEMHGIEFNLNFFENNKGDLQRLSEFLSKRYLMNFFDGVTNTTFFKI